MLKEEDELIELILELIRHPHEYAFGVTGVENVFHFVSEMIRDHHRTPLHSRLNRYCPDIGTILHELDITAALKEYDRYTHLLRRRHVPPTFREVRHILNLATIYSVAPVLKLITFDADDTIYEDGGAISVDSPMTEIIVQLVEHGVVVSLVTAAGYPGQVYRYEERLRGLLEAFKHRGWAEDQFSRFLVMGGECNYLHKTVVRPDGTFGLEEIPAAEWKDGRGVRWKKEEVESMLDVAEATLREVTELLSLPVKIMRKERACGIINVSDKRFTYEVLEEITLTVQEALKSFTVPHCAFNGGNDVWVDVGNKALGIRALQTYVPQVLSSLAPSLVDLSAVESKNCLHVGDRFTRTGNDTRARDVSATLWISNPRETKSVMRKLIQHLGNTQEASHD